eukprot:767237-Hanusia_phi.AAC.6
MAEVSSSEVGRESLGGEERNLTDQVDRTSDLGIKVSRLQERTLDRTAHAEQFDVNVWKEQGVEKEAKRLFSILRQK